MAKVLFTRTPLTNHQLTFLRAHILRERRKAKETGPKPPVITNISPPTSCSDDSGTDDFGGQRSEQVSSTSLVPSLDASEQPLSRVESSSTEQLDAKNMEKGKEGDSETPEDITKQIESLQSHLESLKAEKHRLFQQLKMVLHEEDEKRMKEVEQKQEMEKSMGGEFMSPLDPRLAQASTLGKHPHPISPTTASSLGPPPLKKQASRGPLLPTPDTPYMRQGSTGPFRHLSNSDTYQPPTLPSNPYPPPHQYPGPPAAVPRTPYQDQRAGHAHQITGHAHQVTQDVHMQSVHGNHPPPPMAPQSGITYIQQPQYQGVPLAAGNYQYPTSAPYTNLPSTQSVVQLTYQPQQQQLAPLIPGPQGYPALPHLPHQQVYAQPVSQDVMMQQPPQPGQYHSHEVHPHYLPQGSGGQMVTGGQVYSDLAPAPQQGPYSVLTGTVQPVQDPRQQKLLMEHQRSGGSGGNPLKPVYTKQESHQSSPSARDRKHD